MRLSALQKWNPGSHKNTLPSDDFNKWLSTQFYKPMELRSLKYESFGGMKWVGQKTSWEQSEKDRKTVIQSRFEQMSSNKMVHRSVELNPGYLYSAEWDNKQLIRCIKTRAKFVHICCILGLCFVTPCMLWKQFA